MTTILIIDDSAFMRSLVKDMLLSQSDQIPSIKNAKFIEADGKKTALEKIEHEKPDIILLDIVMSESETEGIEILKAIKPTFDLTNVIIISSIGHEDIIKQYKELGVISYLQKPIAEEEVLGAVNQLIT